MASFGEKDNMKFLGIDGGGSKCRALLTDYEGNALGIGVGGPANPLHGFQKSLDSILDACHQALNQAGLNSKELKNTIAGVGLAGVNLPALYQQMNDWQHPFQKMFLTTDLDIANIGAHGGEEGAVIIVGTGSCGFVSSKGRKNILGGHGFPIGDKASGAWMGLEAIKHTLLVMEHFEKESLLSKMVIEFFGVDNALNLSEKVAGRSSRQFAKLAKIVFEASDKGDIFATSIVKEGAQYIESMSRKLLSESPERLCMIGGLAPFILERLPKPVKQEFVEPLAQPENGAVLYARQSWEKFHKESA